MDFPSFEFSRTEKLFSPRFAIVVLLCGNFRELKGITVEAVFRQVNSLVCGPALFSFFFVMHALLRLGKPSPQFTVLPPTSAFIWLFRVYSVNKHSNIRDPQQFCTAHITYKSEKPNRAVKRAHRDAAVQNKELRAPLHCARAALLWP